jgi:hypothetical protein
MTPAVDLLLKSDAGLLSLFTIGFVVAMGAFFFVWLSNKFKGKGD